jgi:hypothetical protein
MKTETPKTDAVWSATAQIDGVEALRMLRMHGEEMEKLAKIATDTLSEFKKKYGLGLRSLINELERERNAWRDKYKEAVDILAGKLHCREDCKCTDRREVNRLRGFLLENDLAQATPTKRP